MNDSVIIFKDDDRGYLNWLSLHQHGYVLNSYRNPSARYLIMHRPSCFSISGTPANGKLWTDKYLKVCSDSKEALSEWAKTKVGGDSWPCSLCNR